MCLVAAYNLIQLKSSATVPHLWSLANALVSLQDFTGSVTVFFQEGEPLSAPTHSSSEVSSLTLRPDRELLSIEGMTNPWH